ncbi:MAG: alpha/beta hydrolase [Alphaproteobacteria bacterium]|nr:alpha/beta hydrolase [Alphaproteobacteria bacterium]
MTLLLALTLGCTPGDTWYLRTDGVDLPVRVEGNLDSGVVLLMLHGGPQGSAVDYNYGLDTELIEAAYAVAYFDQRTQGGTHGNFDRADLTIQQVADDTHALVDALRARYGADTEVWLYGHSWGGMLGTATLLDTDADVDGWIEAAGSHDYPLNDIYTAQKLLEVGQAELDGGSDYAAEWADILDTVGAMDIEDLSDDDSLTLNQLAFEVEDYLPLADGEFGEESVFAVLARNPTARATAWWSGLYGGSALNEDAQATSYTERLGEITVPSLFIYGDMDFVCPAQLGRDAYERVDTDATEFVLIEDAGHSLMVNRPREYADALIGFVETWR